MQKQALIHFLLALILLPPIEICANPTTPEQAMTVVMTWRNLEDKPMNASLGKQIKHIQTVTDTVGDPLYFVVYLDPAGVVFVPANDLIEPIIGFVSNAFSYDPSPANPIGALVNQDMQGRMLKAKEVEVLLKERSRQAFSSDSPFVLAEQKWKMLKSFTDAKKRANSLPSISDVRVEPFIQSRWNQTGADGSYYPTNYPCYNYYTPPGSAGDPNNYKCGCTATAMAQVMRYWQHPSAGVGTGYYKIYIGGSQTIRNLRGGNGSGGSYDWARMPLTTSTATSVAECQAIGALTADVGVSINTNYSAEISTAWPYGTAFVNTFGYGNAKSLYYEGNIPETIRNAMVNPNLDAQYPVIVSIKGLDGGHAVISDGYGYNGSTLYHHLNMGWSGADDAWYNLPNVVTSHYSFDSINGCTYNIFVAGSGEIISGRVVDSGGKPISGASVTGTCTAGGSYNATTDANGIFALVKVPSASNYTVSIKKDRYFFDSKLVSTGTSLDYQSSTGNVWGVDFTGRYNSAKSLSSVLQLLLLD
jgi:hypothetical protein